MASSGVPFRRHCHHSSSQPPSPPTPYQTTTCVSTPDNEPNLPQSDIKLKLGLRSEMISFKRRRRRRGRIDCYLVATLSCTPRIPFGQWFHEWCWRSSTTIWGAKGQETTFYANRLTDREATLLPPTILHSPESDGLSLYHRTVNWASGLNPFN